MQRPHAAPISRNLYLLVGCAILPALAILLWSGLAERDQSLDEARQRLAYLANGVVSLQTERTGQARVLAKALAALPLV